MFSYFLHSSIRLLLGKKPSGTWEWSKGLSTGRGWSPPSQRMDTGRCGWGAGTSIVHWTRPQSFFRSRRSRRLSECLQTTRRGWCHFLMRRTGPTSTPSLGVSFQRGFFHSLALVFVMKGRTQHHWSSEMLIRRFEDESWTVDLTVFLDHFETHTGFSFANPSQNSERLWPK